MKTSGDLPIRSPTEGAPRAGAPPRGDSGGSSPREGASHSWAASGSRRVAGDVPLGRKAWSRGRRRDDSGYTRGRRSLRGGIACGRGCRPRSRRETRGCRSDGRMGRHGGVQLLSGKQGSAITPSPSSISSESGVSSPLIRVQEKWNCRHSTETPIRPQYAAKAL